METIVKVDINEYEDMMEKYKHIINNLENSTNNFFEDIKMICTFGKIIEGETAKNLEVYSRKLMEILDGELADIIRCVRQKVWNGFLSIDSYIEKVKITDKF